jgi:hypothetical protein
MCCHGPWTYIVRQLICFSIIHAGVFDSIFLCHLKSSVILTCFWNLSIDYRLRVVCEFAETGELVSLVLSLCLHNVVLL